MTMDNEQLISLFLDLYQADKGAKDYLDFFVNPDIDKRMDKAKAAVLRAVMRIKRGMVKPRMTAVKDAIKSISSLSPGEEYVARIMLYTFEQFCLAAMSGRMQDQTLRSIVRHLNETVIYADKNGLASTIFPKIQNIIAGLKTDYMYRRQFKELMQISFENALYDCSNRIKL